MNLITDKCASCEYYRIDPDVIPFCGFTAECQENQDYMYGMDESELPMFLREQAV